MQNALFFSVSGHRSTGRSTLYANLKLRAELQFPGREFAFVGNPFGTLPHPLLLDEMERGLHPTTRLLNLWANVNQFSVMELVPAIEAGKIVISDGFGLDAFLYAISGVDDATYKQVSQLHHGLVSMRLREQGRSPPEYLIVRAGDDQLKTWIRQSAPLLGNTTELALMRHIEHERTAIQDYFGAEHGQNRPYVLDADDCSHDDLCQRALVFIGQSIEAQGRKTA